MAGWKRARTSDRDAAIDVINTAYADGQLGADERGRRVALALASRTLADLTKLTRDLQTHGKAPTDPAGPSDEPDDRPWWQRRSRLGLAVAAVVLAAGVGAVAVDAARDRPDSVPTAVDAPEPAVVPVTGPAIADLVEDYQTQFGTTRSYLFSVQEQLVQVRVPTGDGRARFESWSLAADGSFEQSQDARGAGEYVEFDLADLDTDALGANVDRARSELGVPGPHRTILVVAHLDYDDQPEVAITLTNEFEETGYLITDLSGRILTTRPYTAE